MDGGEGKRKEVARRGGGRRALSGQCALASHQPCPAPAGVPGRSGLTAPLKRRRQKAFDRERISEGNSVGGGGMQ